MRTRRTFIGVGDWTGAGGRFLLGGRGMGEPGAEEDRGPSHGAGDRQRQGQEHWQEGLVGEPAEEE